MNIFLHGPDDFRREERKKWYVKEFEKKHSGLSVREFDLETRGRETLDELKGFIRAQSIFERKKLAILRNIYEADEKQLAELLRSVAEQKAVFTLGSERAKPPKALKFLLEKPSLAERFEHLTGYEWERFAREEARKNGVELTDAALRFLAAVYQNNSWGLVTELQKLSTLKRGAIDKKDLAGMNLEAAPNYWELMNGMKHADSKVRFTALEKFFAMNEPAPKVFNILAAGMGANIPRMARYDLMVKSGKLEYEEVLVDLALNHGK